MTARATLIAMLIAATASGSVAAQRAVLWRDPGDLASKDLRWGSGSEARQPKAPFKFVKEDLSGSKPKVRVIDANGIAWNVKFAGPQREKNEVHAEVAANRIASALGYFVEEDYFVAEGRIEEATGLQRASTAIAADGTFRLARFERRAENVDHTAGQWTLDSNPFVGSKELSGLKILLALVNNWDNKPDNTSVDRVSHSDGSIEERYLISDWGASFGRMAGPPDWSPAPTRWRLDHYRLEPLTDGVTDGAVTLHFAGQAALGSIPVEDARWFAALAGRLHVDQVRAAFEAAGATTDEARGFAARLIEKIDELRSALQSSA